MEVRKPASFKTVAAMVAAVPVVLILVLAFLGSLLPEKTPVERFAFDSATCQGIAGIRHDNPYMYAATKEMYYGAYILCMQNYGHSNIPPLALAARPASHF